MVCKGHVGVWGLFWGEILLCVSGVLGCVGGVVEVLRGVLMVCLGVLSVLLRCIGDVMEVCWECVWFCCRGDCWECVEVCRTLTYDVHLLLFYSWI